MDYMLGYPLGNHHKYPFDMGETWREKDKLELVHNDLWYMKKPLLASGGYILTFIHVSVVPLLNSLKKHISSNKILFCFDEMFEFILVNLMNRQLLKW